jgi:hypothetical protein
MAASGSSGAAGTIELTISLTDTSASECTMRGYPGMLLLGSGGSALPTTIVRGGGLTFERVPVTTVTLTLDRAAYFNVGYSDVVAVPPACSMATGLEITPPTAATNGTVRGLNIQACTDGTLHVSPVFGSTDSTGTSTTAPAA